MNERDAIKAFLFWWDGQIPYPPRTSIRVMNEIKKLRALVEPIEEDGCPNDDNEADLAAKATGCPDDCGCLVCS